MHGALIGLRAYPTAALTEEVDQLLPAKVFGAVESKYNDLMKSQV